MICGVLKLTGAGGTIKGLRFSHYYYNCITVLSGDWLIDDCVFENASTKSRASVGISVKGGVCRLVRSQVERCTRAVSVSSGGEIRIHSSSIENNREAIFTEGTTTVCVDTCSFIDNSTCFQLSEATSGSVSRSTFSNTNENIWGNHALPHMVHEDNQVEENPFLL